MKMKLMKLMLSLVFLSIPINALPLLFSHYPVLKEKIPHIELGDFPTPVQQLKNLNTDLCQLYIKRDDLSGTKLADGRHRYGGNKVRKLEFLLAQALVEGAKTVMTFGCAGSNHAVATSIYAQCLGLKCAVLLKPQANSYNVQKNLLLHQYHGTQLHYYENNELRACGAKKVYDELTQDDGTPPYIIPTGGSNSLGALGFVNAAFELAEQIKEGLLPEPHYIYVACGSCGTVAGLLLGCRLVGLSSTLVCVAVEPESETGDLEKEIKKVFYETNELLRRSDAILPLVAYPSEHIIITHEHAGADYGIFTQEAMQAKELMQEKEHIVLDGTYTSKAFAALISKSKKQKEEPILFWDTFCGFEIEPAQYNSYKNLPSPLCAYFESSTQESSTL
jgi:1-aminocyclopropane-1-carboxylate deaminase/D-cysteine desulfhydrase-like pyridoxal-dependent ACC family enzyme